MNQRQRLQNLVLVLTACVIPASAQSGVVDRSKVQSSRSSQDNGESHRHVPQPIKVTADSPKWQRYQAKGENYFLLGDKEKAKQYYTAALMEIEKNPKTAQGNDPKSRLFRLERDVMRLYPNYPRDKPPFEGDRQIKFDEDELALLSRLRKINTDSGAPADNMIVKILEGQFMCASKDLEKNKEVQKNKPAAEK